MASDGAGPYHERMKPLPTRARELMILAITMIVCCSLWLGLGDNRRMAGWFVFTGAVVLARATFLWWRDAQRS
jgi:hypothetical protein